jgi:hypothetical protein
MAIVTGTVEDFTTTVLGAHPYLIFTPSGSTHFSVAGTGYLFAPKPIKVVPAANGTFSVNLLSNIQGVVDVYYTLTIVWLNDFGVPVGRDYLPWKIRVPYAGGPLADFIDAPWNPGLAFYGPEAPVAKPAPGGLVLNTRTGVLSIWSD